eukprot:TRINITY_DN6208_c0_g1_i1.p1 TRINITY_DN6208_c0_g1~~TRINITY_DN6208_c0_g1_i1.p1  ORF type:complete len:190 (-),score=34.51 TRINITY_DN6208_c0_g1_i1:13-582(-)
MASMPKYQYFLAGGITGWATSVFSTPFELVKLQMQNDNVNAKRFRGSFHCAKTLLAEKGLRSFYTGYTINTIREVAFLSVYFGIYENGKHIIGKAIGDHSSIAIPIAGGLSGASAWFLSFPLDSIKANIQGKQLTGERVNSFRVMRSIFAQKGFFGFYHGVGPSVLRAFLVSSSRFSAYELMYRFLSTM